MKGVFDGLCDTGAGCPRSWLAGRPAGRMPRRISEIAKMALFGRFNSLQVAKHTDFGLYLDGGPDGEILLPKRYVPKDQPTEVGDWLNVFLYLDSEDRPVATTLKPKVQVGGFAS